MNLEEKDKEIEVKEVSEPTGMSIDEQLNILQEVKRVDYQNSLVMKSLQEYNIKFEQLKKDQIDLLENLKSQVESLKESNAILNEKMEDNLTKLADVQREKITTTLEQANDILNATKISLNTGLEAHLKKINDENEEFLSRCEERKKKLFTKWNIMDYFLLIDLFLIPITAGILIYKVFFLR